MLWIRHNWIAVLVVVAVAASVLVARLDRKAADENFREAEVATCLRTAPRAALSVAFQLEAAEARDKAGDHEVADEYRAIATAIVQSMAAPPGLVDKTQLAKIEFVREGDVVKARLMPESYRLLRAGCEAAFPTP